MATDLRFKSGERLLCEKPKILEPGDFRFVPFSNGGGYAASLVAAGANADPDVRADYPVTEVYAGRTVDEQVVRMLEIGEDPDIEAYVVANYDLADHKDYPPRSLGRIAGIVTISLVQPEYRGWRPALRSELKDVFGNSQNGRGIDPGVLGAYWFAAIDGIEPPISIEERNAISWRIAQTFLSRLVEIRDNEEGNPVPYTFMTTPVMPDIQDGLRVSMPDVIGEHKRGIWTQPANSKKPYGLHYLAHE
jgi:hypothetical protein